MNVLLLIAALFMQAAGQLPPQTGIVTGRLTKNGQPAAGVRVSAMVIPERGVAITDAVSLASVVQTDSEGRYQLENIPPGRYFVTAGFLDVPTYYPGVASIDGAKAVNVEAGVTTTGIDFTTAVSAGATISGRVIFPPGQVIPLNQNVTLAGPQRPAPTAVLKPDGSFEVPRVKPGTHTLRAGPVTTTVIVGDADISGIEIEVPYNVSGAFVVEGGGPLPNLSVSFASVRPGAAPLNVALSQAGVFSSQLTPGEYRFAVSGLPAGYALKSITSGSLDLITNPLNLSGGAAPATITATLTVSSPPPWVKVGGRVRGPGFAPSGAPYPVTLTGKGLLAPIKSSLSSDGSFELPYVLPGDYTLIAGTTVSRSIPIHVDKTDLAGVEIVIPAMKEITARVTMDGASQGRAPILITPQNVTTVTVGGAPNAVFYVRSGVQQSFELVLADASGTTTTTATRQTDGTYRVNLPEGERTVTATVTGNTVKAMSYGTSDLLQGAPLKVSAADTSQLEMTLSSLPIDLASANLSNLNNLSASLSVMINTVRIVTTNAQNAATFTFAGQATAPANAQVHVGPDVAQANLLSSVPPDYSAAAAAIRESVTLRADIDKDGIVTNASVIRGHPLLNEAAIAAVKQWRYRPQIVNGQPAAVVTTITVP